MSDKNHKFAAKRKPLMVSVLSRIMSHSSHVLSLAVKTCLNTCLLRVNLRQMTAERQYTS